MRTPIRNRMMAPAILTDSWRSPITCSMAVPANRNASSTTSAISSSRKITHWRRRGSTSFSTDRKMGTLPSGSMTKTRVMKVARMLSIGGG